MEQQRIALSTGITLNVATAGPADGPPIYFLHGFPESHRTWRGLAPLLADKYRLVMPDQRGFAGSDKPPDVEAYRTELPIADLLALAAHFGHDRFTLIGHDWGGAIAWAMAIKGLPQVERLVIINSPHPLIFQKSIIDDPDQRAASQYIRRFRDPAMEGQIRAMGFDAFFAKSFAPHVDLASIPATERQIYIDQWSAPGALEAMLAWYRASMIAVPAMGEDAHYPAWVMAGLPIIKIPTLVLWGLQDGALLPCQLDGMDDLIENLRIKRLSDAGHFAPWQAAEPVAAAMRDWLG